MATVTLSAQPLEIKDGLWYPTNPPTKAFLDQQTSDKFLETMRGITPPKKPDQAAPSPDDAFLKAYSLIRIARESLAENHRDVAKISLQTALSVLSSIQKESPQWGQEIVKDHIELAQNLLATVSAD